MAQARLSEKTDREHYFADIERARALDGPAWLRACREASAEAFVRTPFPHYKEEAWRFTDISPIIKTPFRTNLYGAGEISSETVAKFLYDEPAWTQVVFIDGRFSEKLSRIPKGANPAVRVMGLAEAATRHGDLVRAQLDAAPAPGSAFIALNGAFLRDGAFIHVAPNTKLEAPVHLVFVSSGADTVANHPRNLLALDESAEAVVLETHAGVSDNACSFTNMVEDIVLGDNARFVYHKIVEHGAREYHLSTANVRLGRDAYFKSFVVTLTGQIARNELNVLLAGKGGECSLNGLYLNDGDRLIDNPLFVEHAATHCRSRMGYKGVLDGTSSSVFTGKVLVRRGAQKTDSNQLNNNLLLSDKATIDTKPQLEIFADDVKCTHGATIGGFPRELIFYFQSRGITAPHAQGILTYGFADEIVNQIDVGPLRDRLDRYVFDKYSPK